MRIGEKTDDQSLQMLAEISKSVDAFAQVSRILEDDLVIDDENMAAKLVKKAELPYESHTKEINANQYQVMKFTPQRHHDMLIWIKPEKTI